MTDAGLDAGLDAGVTGEPGTTATTCPECGAQVPRDHRYAPWCDRCEWNLDPDPHEAGVGRGPRGLRARLAARRRKRSDKAVAEVFERVRAGAASSHSPGSRAVVTLIAVAVHGITIALVVGAVLLLITPVWLMVRLVGMLLLLGIAWEVRPRLGRVPDVPEPLDAAAAPHLFALAADVAGVVGARAPQLVQVSGRENASYAVVGLRRIRLLEIGLPLWNRLTAEEKVALLGHELGHDASGDVRRDFPFFAAASSLYRWAILLAPSARWTQGADGALGLLVDVSDWIVRLLMAPLAAAVWALARAAERAALRGGQAAEYRADALGARAAGSAATVGLLRKSLLSEHSTAALRAAVMGRRDGEVWVLQRRAMAEVPEREVDRQERIARRRLHRVDDSHPPTHLRMDLVRASVAVEPSVLLGPEREAAVDAELFAAAPPARDLFG